MRSKRFFKSAYRLFEDQSGATAVEYSIIAGMISTAVVTALQVTGETTKQNFITIEETVFDEWTNGDGPVPGLAGCNGVPGAPGDG